MVHNDGVPADPIRSGVDQGHPRENEEERGVPDQEADEHVISDPELITRVRTGDREAFGELYKRHAAGSNLPTGLTMPEVDDRVKGLLKGDA